MSYSKNRPNVGLIGHTKVSKLRSGGGRNSDSDVRTFRNCDMTRFEIQTGDMHTPLTRRLTYKRQTVNGLTAAKREKFAKNKKILQRKGCLFYCSKFDTLPVTC